MKYKLLNQGGYGSIYINPTRTIICKRLPNYTAGDESTVVYSTIVELAVSALAHTFSGTPRIHNIEIKRNHSNIFMDHHGETLNRWLKSMEHAHIRRKEAYDIIRGLITVLLQFRSANVLHTDIKPCNILLTRINGKIYPTIIDFNCASLASIDYSVMPHRIIYSSSMATYNFAAPELVFSGRPTVTSCIWSLALLACMLFGGEYPIPQTITHNADYVWRNTQSEWKSILRSLQTEGAANGSSAMSIPPYILANMGNDFKLTAWVTRAFSWEPTQRPTLEEVAIAMLDTHIPKLPLPIIEPVGNPALLSTDNRGRYIERFYSIALDTKCEGWFATAVHILDCIGPTTDEEAAACWAMSGFLHNHYALSDDSQVERLYHYFQVRPESLYNIIWTLGSNVKWKLLGRPLDVVLLEDHHITFSFVDFKNIMLGINRPWTPTSYAAIVILSR